jgi:hypothetical protein
MSRKHNTKHRRSLSNYADRLRARGLAKTPVMPDLIGALKRTQATVNTHRPSGR